MLSKAEYRRWRKVDPAAVKDYVKGTKPIPRAREVTPTSLHKVDRRCLDLVHRRTASTQAEFGHAKAHEAPPQTLGSAIASQVAVAG